MSVILAARVLSVIEALGTRCALVGGHALAARGLVRGTNDVDLMSADPSLLDLDWALQLGSGVEVAVFRGDVDDPLRGTVRMTAGVEAIDLVIVKWKWQAAVIQRSEPLDLDVMIVPVPQAADLLLLKVDAGGYLDQRDAAQLIEIHGEELIDAARARLGDVPEALRVKFEKFISDLRRP